MDTSIPLKVNWYDTMAAVPRAAWDRMALPLPTPLLEWQWLHAMEASGSIGPATGWHPRHLTVWEGDRLVGAAPFYIKTHSEGEFVFDQWWARLATEAGLTYYPKLVGMSPVTPAVGYRFLIDPQADAGRVQETMLAAVDTLCVQMGLGGSHLLFADPGWIATVPAHRFASWRHQSFQWRNSGYGTFDDYLRTFKSSQRRNIRRERSRMRQAGIDFQALEREMLAPELAQTMYRYYLNTNAQYGPWGCRYLNADFFERIFEHYNHRLLLIAAYPPGSHRQPAALSMLLHKKGHLIGRYWGCGPQIKDLHFNMCFYEPIQWAIDHQIQTFDPGAGSPHKIQRGFEAVANTSLHRFYAPRMRLLFEHFIGGINQAEQDHIDAMNAQLPFAARGSPNRQGQTSGSRVILSG